jgi:hypothetical protein
MCVKWDITFILPFVFLTLNHVYISKLKDAVKITSIFSQMNEQFVRNDSELGDKFHVTEGILTYHRPTVVRHIRYKIV